MTEPYREDNDAHVPRSTDITDQLDTTGLGGPSQLKDVAPIVSETARRDAVEASAALRGDGRHSSGVQNVILPGDNNELLVDQDRREAAVRQIHDRADELREEGAQSPAEIQAERFAAGAAPAGGDPTKPPDDADSSTGRRRSGKTTASTTTQSPGSSGS